MFSFSFGIAFAALLISVIHFIYAHKRSYHIYYFHYKSNSIITIFIAFLSAPIIISYTLIEQIAKITEIKIDTLDNIVISIATGLLASGVLFMLTYIQTEKEDKNNLNLLLKKIARCHIITSKIKKLSNKTSKNNEIRHHILLFKQEIATAYQIASACKASFIPVIAIADNFIQKLEATNPANITESIFKDIDALHDFLSSNNQNLIKIYSDIPDYKDKKDINKIYKEIYKKIESSRIDNVSQQHRSPGRNVSRKPLKKRLSDRAAGRRQITPLKGILRQQKTQES